MDGKEIKVVSPGYLEENHLSMKDERVEALNSQGKTVVFILLDGEPKGALALADIIRDESRKAISELNARYLKISR